MDVNKEKALPVTDLTVIDLSTYEEVKTIKAVRQLVITAIKVGPPKPMLWFDEEDEAEDLLLSVSCKMHAYFRIALLDDPTKIPVKNLKGIIVEGKGYDDWEAANNMFQNLLDKNYYQTKPGSIGDHRETPIIYHEIIEGLQLVNNVGEPFGELLQKLLKELTADSNFYSIID